MHKVATFEAFYRAQHGFVWHVLGRFGVAPDDRSDLVQDVFVIAYRKCAFPSHVPLRTWLYGITRRVASNHRRGQERAARKHRAAGRALPKLAPATAEAFCILEGFLASLDDGDRELFVLSRVLGLSGAEIVETLRREPALVYRRLRRLRAQLADVTPESLWTALARIEADEPRRSERGWLLLLPLLHPPASALTPFLGATIGALLGVGVPVTWAAVSSADASTDGQSVTASHRAARASRDVATPPSAVPEASEEGPILRASAQASLPGPVAEARLGRREPAAAAGANAGTAGVGAAARAGAGAGAAARADADAHADADAAAGAGADAAPRRAPPARGRSPRSRDDLGRDNALLADMLGAVDRGEASEALRLAQTHARHFPESPQADVRAALRIAALCHRGEVTRARAEARTFLEVHADSPVADRVRRTCDEPSTAGSGAASR